jgi:hypothetical protein
LGLHYRVRPWEGFDWEVIKRLHEKGFISDPRGKAKSVDLNGLREIVQEALPEEAKVPQQ